MEFIPDKKIMDYQQFLLDIKEIGSANESELAIIHKTGREVPVIVSEKCCQEALNRR